MYMCIVSVHVQGVHVHTDKLYMYIVHLNVNVNVHVSPFVVGPWSMAVLLLIDVITNLFHLYLSLFPHLYSLTLLFCRKTHSTLQCVSYCLILIAAVQPMA